MAMMDKLRMKMAFHWRSSLGHFALRKPAHANSIPAAIRKRMAAALKGGTSATSARMASHVLPQTRQRKMYAASCVRVNRDMEEIV